MFRMCPPRWTPRTELVRFCRFNFFLLLAAFEVSASSAESAEEELLDQACANPFGGADRKISEDQPGTTAGAGIVKVPEGWWGYVQCKDRGFWNERSRATENIRLHRAGGQLLMPCDHLLWLLHPPSIPQIQSDCFKGTDADGSRYIRPRTSGQAVRICDCATLPAFVENVNDWTSGRTYRTGVVISRGEVRQGFRGDKQEPGLRKIRCFRSEQICSTCGPPWSVAFFIEQTTTLWTTPPVGQNPSTWIAPPRVARVVISFRARRTPARPTAGRNLNRWRAGGFKIRRPSAGESGGPFGYGRPPLCTIVLFGYASESGWRKPTWTFPGTITRSRVSPAA